jgi:hypothetical protein
MRADGAVSKPAPPRSVNVGDGLSARTPAATNKADASKARHLGHIIPAGDTLWKYNRLKRSPF